jgi:hypothetical protein
MGVHEGAVARYAETMQLVHGWESHGSVGPKLKREDLRSRLPVGMVTEKDDGFRLIDGYHRVEACQ